MWCVLQEVKARMATKPKHQSLSERRRIIFESSDQQDQTEVILEEIERRQNQETRLFMYGNSPVMTFSNHDGVQLRTLTARRLKTFLQTEARFFKLKKINEDLVPSPSNLSLDLCEHVLAKDNLKQWFPPIERILRSPVFDEEGGLCTTQGYHKGIKAWLELDFEPLATVSNPTKKQTERALEIIQEIFLGDFPFVDEASKAHAVALGLLPFVRPMIEGPTPLHLVTAPVPRTGKTKLVISLALGTTGALPTMCPPSNDEEEWRKKITSTLLRSPQLVLIDNLPMHKRTDNHYLASVLTLGKWEDRVLGTAENVKLPNHAVWAATGNNPSMTSELVDRSAWIQLDPKVPDPSQRTGFKHEQIERWAKTNRHMLCWAFMTLIRGWIAKGKPRFGKGHLGGFESWAHVIGGILEVAGVKGFLQNHKALKARSDGETNEWREFVSAWWSQHTKTPVGISELFQLSEDNDLLDQVRGSGSDRSQRIKMGKALTHQLERVFDVETQNGTLLLRIERVGINKKTKTKLYSLFLLE